MKISLLEYMQRLPVEDWERLKDLITDTIAILNSPILLIRQEGGDVMPPENMTPGPIVNGPDTVEQPQGPSFEDLPVNISRVQNGFIVAVGCKRFVFPTIATLTQALKDFYTYPQKAYEKYCRKPKE